MHDGLRNATGWLWLHWAIDNLHGSYSSMSGPVMILFNSQSTILMMGINYSKGKALVYVSWMVHPLRTPENPISSMLIFDVKTMGLRIRLKIFLYFNWFIPSLRL